MSVYKDQEFGTWRVVFRYTDWQGHSRQTQKRGFATRREAVAWEAEQKAIKRVNLHMKFSSYVELYYEDIKSRVRLTTFKNKEYIIETKILPYFKDRKVDSITPRDIICWQNEMKSAKTDDGSPYAETYLRTIHNQMSALFNHAVLFYGLPENPCRKAGSMGKKEAPEMLFWTLDEYEKFAEVMMDNPRLYYAFEILYWCGLREGELLALTKKDIDFKRGTITVVKSYQRIEGDDIFTDPKTPKGFRVIDMPDFLVSELKDYVNMQYKLEPDERLFKTTKYGLNKAIERGAKKAGVKKIRVHDLRHSHVSLLINQGFSAVDIGKRVGHKAIDITLRYAHMFPSTQQRMVEELNNQRKVEKDEAGQQQKSEE
ncbi:MAG: site-specific integrase [Clostridiales bacterium]|nr:site-specific integrase [Candidatus Crickella equi]